MSQNIAQPDAARSSDALFESLFNKSRLIAFDSDYESPRTHSGAFTHSLIKTQIMPCFRTGFRKWARYG